MALKDLPTLNPLPVDPGTAVTLYCVVIDGDRAYIDAGALHGRSEAEEGVEFSADPDAAAGGRVVHIVWVGVRQGADERDGYFSAVCSSLRIDAESGTGFRPDDHFIGMITAIQGEVRLDDLDENSRSLVASTLRSHDEGLWDRRSRALAELWPD